MNKANKPEDSAVFRRGLLIARRNLVLIAICVLLVPIAAFAYSKTQTKEYTASASLLFVDDERDLNNSDPIREAATNLRLASLEEVAIRTAKAMPGNFDRDAVREKITVAPEGESELIAIAATDPSPAVAARLANTFAASSSISAVRSKARKWCENKNSPKPDSMGSRRPNAKDPRANR